MSAGITVLIVGAGRFAHNYVRTLAGLSCEPQGLFPPVATLIVSRTQLAAAQGLAAEIRQDQAGCFAAVLGVEIRHAAQLATVLAQHRPELICITARDRQQGHAIHAAYAPLALAYGAVLCEKPFSAARGDGISLEPMQALLRHPYAGRFSLELPLAIVGPAMLADSRLGPLLSGAGQIEFFWQKQSYSDDLVGDLAVHPWSLLPAVDPMVVDKVQKGKGWLEACFRWGPEARAGRMVLAVGGRFRGLCVDGRVLELRFAKDRMQVLEHTAPWESVISGRLSGDAAALLLEVDNPLRQHLVALLQGDPLVDLKQAYASQLFLEQLCGYR